MSACGRCGAAFACAQVDGDGAQPCWCAGLPPLAPLPGGAAPDAAPPSSPSPLPSAPAAP